MWYECLTNNVFLCNLFDEVPELHNVIIEQFDISHYAHCIRMVINAPFFVDNVPLKWKQRNYNSLSFTLDFYSITPFEFSLDQGKRSDISIFCKQNSSIIVEIKGRINTSFVAESGRIQTVEGYKRNACEL